MLPRLRSTVMALLFLAGGTAVPAQEVTITRGDMTLTGEVMGYDGTYLRLLTDAGEVTLDYRGSTCDGATCPLAEDWVPHLRLSGSGRMSEVLVPALIEGYARARGQRATRRDVNATTFEYDIDRAEDGGPVLRFSIHVGSSDEGFADLLANQTDVALSQREITAQEVALGRAAGLGSLSDARRSEIIALDALVPVVSPRRRVNSLSLSDLAALFSGDVANWSGLGQPAGAVALHLPRRDAGLVQAFVARVLDPVGVSLADTITFHDDLDEMTQAVAEDPDAIGIAPYRSAGTAVTVPLGGGCGMTSRASLTTLKTEDYMLTQPLFLYLPVRRLPEAAQDWMGWLRTTEAQTIVRRAGFVDRGPVPVPMAQQGDRLARAIQIAGEEVALSDLQEMIGKLVRRQRLSTTFRFNPGSTRLDAQSRSNMLQLARSLRDGGFDGQRLFLVGFSDGKGPAEANRALSLARAESVRRAMLRALGGVLPDQASVEIDAFGEALPMACDDTEGGRQANRRVELWVGR